MRNLWPQKEAQGAKEFFEPSGISGTMQVLASTRSFA
jgi:hypothetical protein